MPPAHSASDLTDHLGYWLRYVSNHVSQAFARKVEAHGVTVAEWVLMRQLPDEKALAPSRLAERMGMTRGAISKLADANAAEFFDHLAAKDRVALLRMPRNIVEKRDLKSLPVD
ncbi:MAG: MarR family winged helix-turn-helix transcriptional regulator [Acetobacteraceae bacterium]